MSISASAWWWWRRAALSSKKLNKSMSLLSWTEYAILQSDAVVMYSSATQLQPKHRGHLSIMKENRITEQFWVRKLLFSFNVLSKDEHTDNLVL